MQLACGSAAMLALWTAGTDTKHRKTALARRGLHQHRQRFIARDAAWSNTPPLACLTSI